LLVKKQGIREGNLNRLETLVMRKNLYELQDAMRRRQQMQETTNSPEKRNSGPSPHDESARSELEVALQEAERAMVLVRVEQAQEILHDAEARFARIIDEAVRGKDYASVQLLAGLAARIKRISNDVTLERARVQQGEY
jgi:hypothetical protein